MSSDDRAALERTRPEVRRTRWAGWIWAIPFAALIVVGWWGFRTFMAGGEDITISFDDAHGMKESDTKVVYRGIKVGEVKSIKLAKNGDGVDVTVEIADSATRFLKSGTMFWLRGAHPSLADLSSLASVLSGPTIVMEPGPGAKTKRFVGLAYRPVIYGAHPPPRLYGVSLGGSVGGLTPGEPVKFEGFTVGEVKDVGFRYDAKSGEIKTPVTLALYPSLFRADDADKLGAEIDRLIQNGLRARLERDPPMIGTPQVALELASGEKNAAPGMVAGLPAIPAAPGGGITSIVDRINKVPVEQIAHNLLDVTHHADALVASPHLNDAIAQLDGALAQLHQTADKTGPQISQLVGRLRGTADRLDGVVSAVEKTANAARRAASSANNMLGGAPEQNNAQKAMREITEAARSVRELADYLDRHPEALIQGRSGG
jgi:paraquat-inducible protein B